MTPQEHYQVAENLLGIAGKLGDEHPLAGEQQRTIVMVAQVHATLATVNYAMS